MKEIQKCPSLILVKLRTLGKRKSYKGRGGLVVRRTLTSLVGSFSLMGVLLARLAKRESRSLGNG